MREKKRDTELNVEIRHSRFRPCSRFSVPRQDRLRGEGAVFFLHFLPPRNTYSISTKLSACPSSEWRSALTAVSSLITTRHSAPVKKPRGKLCRVLHLVRSRNHRAARTHPFWLNLPGGRSTFQSIVTSNLISSRWSSVKVRNKN